MRLRNILDTVVAKLYGLDAAGFGCILRDCEVIREELRNRAYEVITIPYGHLTDPQSMRNHFYRLGRILLGKSEAEAIRDDASWFDAANHELGVR